MNARSLPIKLPRSSNKKRDQIFKQKGSSINKNRTFYINPLFTLSRNIIYAKHFVRKECGK